LLPMRSSEAGTAARDACGLNGKVLVFQLGRPGGSDADAVVLVRFARWCSCARCVGAGGGGLDSLHHVYTPSPPPGPPPPGPPPPPAPAPAPCLLIRALSRHRATAASTSGAGVRSASVKGARVKGFTPADMICCTMLRTRVRRGVRGEEGMGGAMPHWQLCCRRWHHYAATGYGGTWVACGCHCWNGGDAELRRAHTGIVINRARHGRTCGGQIRARWGCALDPPSPCTAAGPTARRAPLQTRPAHPPGAGAPRPAPP